MTHETLTSSQLSVKAAALRMVDLPLSVYGSLAQVSLLQSCCSDVVVVVVSSYSSLNLKEKVKSVEGMFTPTAPSLFL